MQEVGDKRDELVTERDDLIEAIRQLRTAIANLNKEGRERLLIAFDEVNAHFKHLFTHLFAGGTAELILTESDDPLEAGLDIIARPPGKKPRMAIIPFKQINGIRCWFEIAIRHGGLNLLRGNFQPFQDQQKQAG